MEELSSIFKQIGLKGQETKVYLALLEAQEAKTGELCRITRIASSHIYSILESLMQKGLVSYRVQNNTKIFMPSPPEALHNIFDEKQKLLEEQKSKLEQEKQDVAKIISFLKKNPIIKKPYSNYKYYEGIGGIKSMWHELDSVMSNKDEILIYTCKREGFERLIGFYSEHHVLRQKKKVVEKLIYPYGEEEHARKRYALVSSKYTKIRFLNLNNTAEWLVHDNILMIQHIMGKQPRGFLIKDKHFADTFKQVFNQLWEKSVSLQESLKKQTN